MGRVNKHIRNKQKKPGAAKPGKAISKAKALAHRPPSHPRRTLPSPATATPPYAISPQEADTAEPCTSGVLRRRKPLSEHQQALQRKLEGGNFRILNETLYKTTGERAFSLMQSDPSLFTTYHAGYTQQTARWPANPLDDVLLALTSEPEDVVIADFGCGEARLSREARQIVHSFDLIASAPGVVACDMSKVPLPDNSVEIAVFCLSLMGTNYGEYITEARRVLQNEGLLLVAEVSSRFENHNPREFVKAVESLGFSADTEHPFATGGCTYEADVQDPPPASATKSGKRKKGTKGVKKRGGAKHKKKGTALAKEQVTEKQQASAFFQKFAFISTKKSRDDIIQAQRCLLPELAPCVYKKR